MVKDEGKGLQKLNITFSGCGFLGIYHVGVANALKDKAPRLLDRIESFGGASAGALAASSLLCGVSLKDSLDFTLRLAQMSSKLSIGPFHPRFRLTKTIRKVFTRMMPEDSYKRCSGKLHISLTRCSDWKNVVVSEFHSNEDLVDALVASAHVPFYSGIMPPKFRGVYHVDGGITNNLPQHFDGETITVTPWNGESDICPHDDSNSINHIMFANTSIRFSSQNFYRICRAFLPPDADALCEMCMEGYRDTIKYLKTHYPEYLVDPSCCCPVSSNTLWDTPTDQLLYPATGAPIVSLNYADRQLAEGEVGKKCGECYLRNVLELAKVDAAINEEKQNWLCYVIGLFYNLLIKPCLFTISQITQIAESVILKLPKVYTGVDFLDLLLHTIDDVIVHYKIYQNIHPCTDSCLYKPQVYTRTSTRLESTKDAVDVGPPDSENSVGYDTACSESSYVTCQSLNSDEELDSSSDTIVDDVFTGPSSESCTIGQISNIRPHAVNDKVKWNSDVDDILQGCS